MPEFNLQGCHVLLTRPAHQAQTLSELIQAANGQAVAFPTLQITPPADTAAIQAQLAKLAQYDLAVFVSTNAVEHCMALLAKQALPDTLKIAAIGKSTAKALRDYGYNVDLQPEQAYSSESLLAMPALQQLDGQKIVIVRGNGGRPILAETLAARGANVDFIEVYQRHCPPGDPALLSSVLATGQPLLLIATSRESLDNLMQMAGTALLPVLQSQALIVISQRIQEYAIKQGFNGLIRVASEANDAAIMAELAQAASTLCNSNT